MAAIPMLLLPPRSTKNCEQYPIEVRIMKDLFLHQVRPWQGIVQNIPVCIATDETGIFD